jgi:hypothetical protein
MGRGSDKAAVGATLRRTRRFLPGAGDFLQALLGNGVVRIDPKRGLKRLRGAVQVAQIDEHKAEVTMELVVAGIELDRGLKFHLRLVEPLLEPVEQAEVIMRLVVIGLELRGALKILQRFIGLAALEEERLSEFVVGFGVVGIESKHVTIVSHTRIENLGLHAFFQSDRTFRSARHELQPEFPHFVGGLETVLDAPRRLIGVAWVLCGIVVGECHCDDRAFRQENRLLVGVVSLPVEVPIIDANQTDGATVRQRGSGLHPPAEKMSVGQDAHQFHIRRNGIGVAQQVAFFARRDVDVVGPEADFHGPLRRGMIGEIKPDRWLNLLGLS